MEMDIATAAALLDIKYAGEGATDTKALLRAAKAAYRKLALKYHPDKNGGSRKAQIMFVKVGIAYKTIIEAIQNENVGEFEEEGGLFVDEDDLEFFRKHRIPSIDDVLKAALDGSDMSEVEDMLRLRGGHRPPADFGCFPYPNFTDKSRGQSLEKIRIEQAQELALQEDERYRRAMAAADQLLMEDED